ncbi:MAG: MBL fold metallo-hydrolase [Bryobacterales bacterium]|nr:MBL fold metallo-hydrolase [Bryobacterales bacterium]
MNYTNILSAAAAAAMTMLAGPAAAQAHPDSMHVAQPHLEAALRLAAQENSWRHPGLVSCYWAEGVSAQDVNKDPGGYKIFDNLYFVGNHKLSVYAIDTSDGIILTDAMNSPAEVEKYVIPNLKAVGLDPARLKILIMAHGHADHFGGSGYLVEKYHVRAYLSAADWDLAEKTVKAPGYNRGMPARRAGVLKDGDTITLGEESIRIYLTPGHSPGSTAMLIPVKDKGQARLLAYFGGIENPLMLPETGRSYEAFDQSFSRMSEMVEAAKVDGYLAAHSNYDDAPFKIEVMRHNPPSLPNPFLIGTARVVLFTKMSRECNLNNADVHRAMPKLKAY